MWLLASISFLAALLVTLAALYGLAPRRAVSDESEYLARAVAEDPFRPQPFLRLPLPIWIASRFRSNPEPRLRGLNVVFSSLTVVLAGSIAWQVGGTQVAILATALLVLHPERTLLACHLWPDGLVALLVSGVTLSWVLLPALGWAAWGLLALACALGCLTRIDFVVVLPVLFYLAISEGSLSPAASLLLMAPAVLALALWSLRNYRRYGIPLPDDTWAFNLMIARAESQRNREQPFALDPIVKEAFTEWRAGARQRGSRAWEFLKAAVTRPHRIAGGIGRRLLAFCGPDTFVTQKVLPADRAYPGLDEAMRRRLGRLLTVATPLTFTLAGLGILARGSLPPWAWPAASLAVISVLFFTRTRYRIAVLPIAAVLAAQGIGTTIEEIRSPRLEPRSS